MTDFIKKTLDKMKKSNCEMDYTFFQAVTEVLESIEPLIKSDPKYEKHSIISRIVIPDREIKFKITWLNDKNEIEVNNGYRIQFNNTLGVYKGGLRFHKSVNSNILKFLAFEQIFKNALTDLPMGGAKGGSDFDPKNKSDTEIMKFCKAFMIELHRYIGSRIDVPAGDIGVGAREIGYLYGAYKSITSTYEGVLTGKPYFFGGSLLRPEATGYGVVYFAKEILKLENKDSLKGKICTVSGSGNVAIYTMEKLNENGAIVVTCSDSLGTIYDKRGIDIKLLKEIKFAQRTTLKEYIKTHKEAQYIPKEKYEKDMSFAWSIPTYLAFPCATQNELSLKDAQNLINNDCHGVFEGANMPTTMDAVTLIQKSSTLFAPSKAANAGGVIVSEFEMSQNASLQKWSREDVDKKLKSTMQNIAKTVVNTAIEYNVPQDYVKGANIYSFKKVADAMIAEGV